MINKIVRVISCTMGYIRCHVAYPSIQVDFALLCALGMRLSTFKNFSVYYGLFRYGSPATTALAFSVSDLSGWVYFNDEMLIEYPVGTHKALWRTNATAPLFTAAQSTVRWYGSNVYNATSISSSSINYSYEAINQGRTATSAAHTSWYSIFFLIYEV